MNRGRYLMSPGGDARFSIGRRLASRWSDWRWRRSNSRRCGEQVRAREAIVGWLPEVLGDDGSVTGWEHSFGTDRVVVDVMWRGAARRVRVGPLTAWPNIERRDVVASEMLDVLGEPDADEVALGWIAEEEWLDRGEWQEPVRRRGLPPGTPGAR